MTQDTQPSSSPSTAPATASRLGWPAPTGTSKPWTRWWWLGSAVDRAGLTDALQAYADAGFGGVEVCPIYGAMGAEDRIVRFLSPAWIALLRHAIAEARRLGMSLDLTTGTGWPFGGPQVGPDDASCKLLLSRHTVAGGEELDVSIDAGTFEDARAVGGRGASIDLRDRLSNGRIRWDAPADGGPWQVVVAVRKAPIQKVKRAAPGGEGNVVDPYDANALDDYLAAFDVLFDDPAAPKPHGQFHDSFEYFDANWSPAFLREFQARRGYDLRPHIPALAGVGEANELARIVCDYRQTIAELHLNYVVHWMEWCHRHDAIAREQAHGAPANLIDLYASCDVPETELFGVPDERDLPMHKFASSASNLAARPLTSSESFTWLGEHFQVTLADAKAEADYLFLTGVNRLVFHGIAYSPVDEPWPGWLFYASVDFGRTGGLWRDLPAFTAYLARCQSVLQSGRPSRDVLLYFPIYDYWQPAAATTAPSTQPPLLVPFGMHDSPLPSHAFHAAAMTLWRGGYLFDEVSDHFLNVAECSDGHVAIGGTRYSTVIVPSCRVMPTQTLKSVIDLARRGATVIFAGGWPEDVPGWHDAQARREELRAAIPPAPHDGTIPIGKGSVILGRSLEAMLPTLDIRRESMADLGLLCERREQPDGHTYFIVNRGRAAFDGWAPLDTPVRAALLLDPRSDAAVGRAAVRQHEGRAEIFLQLQSAESIVLQTFARGDVQQNAWPYRVPAGEPRPIVGRWRVEFVEGGPVLPCAYEVDRLASWTAAPDAKAKRFAGTARYRVTFDHAPAANVEGWRLDLGKVCESARVKLNGHDVGVAWSAPFALDVGEWLRSGSNELEVEVTNLAANRIADLDRRGVQWKRFHEVNFVNKDYKTFDASGRPLRDSGLIGPVTLTPLRNRTPA